MESRAPTRAALLADVLLQVDHVDLYTNQRRVFSSQPAALVAAGTPDNGDAAAQPGLRWETRNVNP
jgi:hypothetical protein